MEEKKSNGLPFGRNVQNAIPFFYRRKKGKKTMLINCVRMMREQPKKKKTRFSLHT